MSKQQPKLSAMPNCLALAVVLALFGAAVIDMPASQAQNRDRDATTIRWPSPAFRTLQAAIDAAPDGATIEIDPGAYRLSEPIFVRDKRLTITGAGSGRESLCRSVTGRKVADTVTRLIGPPPSPVLDGDRMVILPAESVVGLFNLVAAEVLVQDLRLSGFDAGVVSRTDDGGNAAPVRVENCVISDTGRGVLAISNSHLVVEDVSIYNPLWHALSVEGFETAVANVKNCFISNPQGAGMYFENTNVFISDDVVTGALEGGIVCFQSTVSILNSTLTMNQKHGILLVNCLQTAFISGNLIEDTQAYQYPSCLQTADGCFWGDGITIARSSATFTENTIINSERAGLGNFGGHANLSDNDIVCSAFPLNGEVYLGQSFSFSNNVEDNACGCPSAVNGTCLAESAGLEPPEPLPDN